MRNHPLPTWLKEERLATDARIRSAFRGVSRNAGITWSESIVIDDYGTDDERKLVRAKDTERSWEQLVDDPTWDPDIPCGGFNFLDSISARYYLAPAMLRAMWKHQTHSVSFHLSRYPAEKWDLPDHVFTEPQCLAIYAFLRFMALFELYDGLAEGSWHESLDNDWRRFAQPAPPPLSKRQKQLQQRRPALPPPAHVAGIDDKFPLWMSDERVAIEALVRSAFKGVSREGGTSWSESIANDMHEGDEECLAARARDVEPSWEALVDDAAWDPGRGIGGFNFLDPIGYRYYMAPLIVRCLSFSESLPGDRSSTHGEALSRASFSLCIDDPFHTERVALFTPKQCHAVYAFLRLMVLREAIDEGHAGSVTWSHSLNCYWQRFASSPQD